MDTPHYREMQRSEGLSTPQRAWLVAHGADEPTIDAWLRGTLTNKQAATFEQPGDDLTTPALGVVAVLGCVVPVVAWKTHAPWALYAMGAYGAMLVAAVVYRVVTPTARRLGFGPVERLAVTVSFGQKQETDEDGNTRTWKTLRWHSPSGLSDESVFPQKTLEALATLGASVRCQLFLTRRKDRRIVLAVVPDSP